MKVIFKFFKRDFPVKKITWNKFLKGFLWKIEAEGKILQGSPLYFGENRCKKRDFFEKKSRATYF